MIHYQAPTTDDLQRLKDSLGYTGKQMADLASLSSDVQWRKYTGGAQPREVNLHMLFLMAARLTLAPQELRSVADKMRELGAQVDAEELLRLPTSYIKGEPKRG